FRMFVQPVGEDRLSRRVDADELDVGSVAEPVEQSRIGGRTPSRFLAFYAFGDVEVVDHLSAIFPIFSLRGVMVADARIDRQAIDDVTVRLMERKVPVVVFISLAADRNAE